MTIKNLRPEKLACGTGRTPGGSEASTTILEPLTAVSEPVETKPAPPENARVRLGVILSETPGQEGYSAVQLAKELAPRVGVSEATARKYIGEYRRAQIGAGDARTAQKSAPSSPSQAVRSRTLAESPPASDR
jgi:hypothetical protein